MPWRITSFPVPRRTLRHNREGRPLPHSKEDVDVYRAGTKLGSIPDMFQRRSESVTEWHRLCPVLNITGAHIVFNFFPIFIDLRIATYDNKNRYLQKKLNFMTII